MADRSAADTRYFPDRVGEPWRAAGGDVPDGRVVIVAGTPQSGRSTVLHHVAGPRSPPRAG